MDPDLAGDEVDVFHVHRLLGGLEVEEPGLYQAMEKYHNGVGNAVLDLQEESDVASVEEIAEYSGIEYGYVEQVLNGLEETGLIEREEEEFYRVSSYGWSDRNMVEQAFFFG